MKNYTDSDYALNKHSRGIVYRFTDGIVEVTLADYLAENPGKTADDFRALKALSDADYYKQDRDGYRKARKDVAIHGLEETKACAVPSLEDELIDKPAESKAKVLRQELGLQAFGKLTEIQRRRYIQYHVGGLTEEQIAKQEGSTQQAVSKSLYWAEKKIKKFLLLAEK